MNKRVMEIAGILVAGDVERIRQMAANVRGSCPTDRKELLDFVDNAGSLLINFAQFAASGQDQLTDTDRNELRTEIENSIYELLEECRNDVYGN